MNNELFFFFFSQLNETSVCKYYWREPRLAFPLRRVTESEKPRRKKTKWSSHRTESSPISCWDDFTEAGQRRPKSQPHCDCGWAPTTHNPLQLFLFFNQWHGWKKKKKKRRCLAPTMHAVLQHNVMHDSEEEGKKTNKTKAKVKFPVYRFACFDFVLHVEGRQAQFLFLLLLLFKHSLKRESSFTQVAPRLPLKWAACDDGQPTGFLFFRKARGGQTDGQTCAEAIVPSFLPYSAKLTN